MSARRELEYLRGDIDEDELLARAGNSQRGLAEAHYCIGIRKLAYGDRLGARGQFEKAAASPVFYWGPVEASDAIADRMNKYPNWPDWDWLPAAPSTPRRSRFLHDVAGLRGRDECELRWHHDQRPRGNLLNDLG